MPIYQKTLFCPFLLLVLFVPAYPTLTLHAHLEKSTGSTLYQLESRDTTNIDYTGNPVQAFVQSELEYPLNQINADFKVTYSRSSLFAKKPGYIFASGFTRLSQPTLPMYDSDWIGVNEETSSGFSNSASRTRFKFSYTESDLKMDYFGFGMGALVEATTLFKKPLSLGLTFRYHYYYADIYGISGWQYGNDTIDGVDTMVKYRFYNLYQDTAVLTYEAHASVISLAASYPLFKRPTFAWILDAEFSPGLSFADDEDYHLLRFKRINSSTQGISFLMNTTLSFKLQRNLAFETSLGFRYIRNSGTMVQTWYKDEVYDEYTVTSGTRLTDIPSTFRSLTGWLKVGMAMTF